MKLLKNRIFAACLLAVVVCFSTVNSIEDDLSDLSYEVTSSFYWNRSGASKSIYERLESRSDAANGMTTIANNYPALAAANEKLKFAQGELAELLEYYGANQMEDLYAANEDLEVAFQDLEQALREQTLLGDDQKQMEYYVTTFEGAQRMIEDSDYNDLVTEYYGKTHRFPISMLLDILDIEQPQYFE